MRGITRPCRHTLDPELKQKWMSHLCGLCLTLRGEGGQRSRILTGYDLLLLSVLVEAQTGATERETAGPCPLRGMRSAAVVPASSPGARLAAAGSLLAGSAAIEDKLQDGDIPHWADPVAARWARSTGLTGRRLAGESQLDADLLSRGVRRAAAAEEEGGSLEELLAPSGEVVAELFAHTASVAGRPANADPLRRVGDAFGRLVHLLDAVDDHPADLRHGRFNPLAATSTPPDEARRLALRLATAVRDGLDQVDFSDPELALTLLGPVLQRSVQRSFASVPPSTPTDPAAGAKPTQMEKAGAAAAAAVAATVAAAPAVMLGIFGRPWRRRPPYGGDPYGPPPGYGYGGYGYGRRGPSCCDLLACDCCANMACNDCCGGDDDCCVCCC